MTILKYCDLDKIKNSLDYETDSIITKTMFEYKNRIVTGYAFDRGKSVFPCKEPVNLTLHILEGQAEVMVAGQSYNIGEGEKILMPKNEFHALFAKTKLKLALIKG